jgi:hypothetical protein
MPHYAVLGTHPPNVCPIASKPARELAIQAYQQLPSLSKKLGVKVLQDLHLDPSHKAFMLFDAPSAEAVRDLLVQAGFMGFLELDLHLVTPIPDLMRQAERFPTVY